MNQITIAGHLGSDPEVRFTSSGQKVTTLRVAARARRGKNDETIWWRVTIWGEQFDKMIPYFKKGSAIIVFGELTKPEIFTDKEGRPQISMNLTALNLSFNPFGKPEGSGSGSNEQNFQAPQATQTQPSYNQESYAQPQMAQAMQGQGRADPIFNEDEIPF